MSTLVCFLGGFICVCACVYLVISSQGSPCTYSPSQASAMAHPRQGRGVSYDQQYQYSQHGPEASSSLPFHPSTPQRKSSTPRRGPNGPLHHPARDPYGTKSIPSPRSPRYHTQVSRRNSTGVNGYDHPHHPSSPRHLDPHSPSAGRYGSGCTGHDRGSHELPAQPTAFPRHSLSSSGRGLSTSWRGGTLKPSTSQDRLNANHIPPACSHSRGGLEPRSVPSHSRTLSETQYATGPPTLSSPSHARNQPHHRDHRHRGPNPHRQQMTRSQSMQALPSTPQQRRASLQQRKNSAAQLASPMTRRKSSISSSCSSQSRKGSFSSASFPKFPFIGIVCKNFDPTRKAHLQVREGERLQVLSSKFAGWVECVNGHGQQGGVPAQYITPIEMRGGEAVGQGDSIPVCRASGSYRPKTHSMTEYNPAPPSVGTPRGGMVQSQSLTVLPSHRAPSRQGSRKNSCASIHSPRQSNVQVDVLGVQQGLGEEAQGLSVPRKNPRPAEGGARHLNRIESLPPMREPDSPQHQRTNSRPVFYSAPQAHRCVHIPIAVASFRCRSLFWISPIFFLSFLSHLPKYC